MAILTSDDAVCSFIELLIIDVCEFFNIGKPMTSSQIIQTARLIFFDYSALKPEDVKKCFEQGKKGLYGKIYDRLDGGVLFDWLDNYKLNRTNEIIQHRINELNNHNAEIKKPIYIKNSESIEKIKEIRKNLEQKLTKDRIDYIENRFQKNVEKSEEDILVQKWLRYFDRKMIKQGKSFIATRWGIMNQEQYAMFRLKKYRACQSKKT